MSWIATSVIAVSSIYSTVENKKTAKKGRRDAKSDEIAARKAEVFAETEGSGTGQLGQISLAVDDDLEDEKLSSTVSI